MEEGRWGELERLLDDTMDVLNEAMEALVAKERRELERKVWLAASNVEYMTFVMSLFSNPQNPKWKEEPRDKDQLDLGPALLTAHDLLRQAREALRADKEAAYHNAWMARGYLLRVQEALEKGKLKK